MNNLLKMLEDLWVAVTFAEAGINVPSKKLDQDVLSHDAVHVRTA